MGFFGFGWFKDELERLKALRDITKNEEEKAELSSIIENLENKCKEDR